MLARQITLADTIYSVGIYGQHLISQITRRWFNLAHDLKIQKKMIVPICTHGRGETLEDNKLLWQDTMVVTAYVAGNEISP